MYSQTHAGFFHELIPLMYQYNGFNYTENHQEMILDDIKGFNRPIAVDELNSSANQSFHNTGTLMCIDDDLDSSNINGIERTSFWVEGVFQLIVGLTGILANISAIPILRQKSMKSSFNTLLICLLILHTVYTSAVILMEIISPTWDNPRIDGLKLIVIFYYVLDPLQHLMLYSSTIITVLLARQRYHAIRYPIEYRNNNLTIQPWVPAIKAVGLAFISSGAFILPLFFERSIKYEEVASVRDVNDTYFQYVSKFIIQNITFGKLLLKISALASIY